MAPLAFGSAWSAPSARAARAAASAPALPTSWRAVPSASRSSAASRWVGSVWVLPAVVAASWAVSIASRLRVVNFSAPNWLICTSVSYDSWRRHPVWRPMGATNQKLSRFPSTLAIFRDCEDGRVTVPEAPSLVADCEQCFALCCVLLPFSAVSGFGMDKPGGMPCPNLADDDRCRIHATLRQDGWSGCVTFDCFGAGQQVSQVTYGGVSWREHDNLGEMAAVLSVMRVLHEMLAHLIEVGRRSPEPAAADLASEIIRMTGSTPNELLDIDLDHLHARVGSALEAASARLRSGIDLRGRDLAGRDLRRPRPARRRSPRLGPDPRRPSRTSTWVVPTCSGPTCATPTSADPTWRTPCSSARARSTRPVGDARTHASRAADTPRALGLTARVALAVGWRARGAWIPSTSLTSERGDDDPRRPHVPCRHAHGSGRAAARPTADAAVPAGRSGGRGVRAIALVMIIAGAIFTVGGVVAYFAVQQTLADQKIVVADDADMFAGKDVNGPFTAYAQAMVIGKHAKEIGKGKTYAELPQDDPNRDTVMTASFLQASLFTSVVAFGVAAMAAVIGILLILLGIALRRLTPRGAAGSLTPAAPPDDERGAGVGLAHDRQLVGVGTTGGHRRAECVAGGGHLGRELLVASPESRHLVLQLEDPAYPLDPDATRRERGDLAEQLDVAVAVAATAAAGPARHDQAHPLVGTQRLRMQPGQLGRHADHVHSGVRRQSGLRAHDGSKRLARSVVSAPAAR